MKNFTVKSNSPGNSSYSISGRDLSDAIEGWFHLIAKDAGLGNVAGYQLVQVSFQFQPGILGGKGGAELTITHRGLDLAHRPASGVKKTTTVWIHCRAEDAPCEVTIPIAQAPSICGR